jgi:hypothetical protein
MTALSCEAVIPPVVRDCPMMANSGRLRSFDGPAKFERLKLQPFLVIRNR